MTAGEPLSSWRPGQARDALLDFLDRSRSLPPAERVACFDNDGTLWCERPTYVQYEFFLDALRRRVADQAAIGQRREFAALLAGDGAAIAELGLERVALALAGLFDGLTPEEFAAEARTYLATASHPSLDRPVSTTTYQPMLELIDELRRHQFTVGIVTGGGTEFVRAVSNDLYGVPPELVVGTLIAYELVRDAVGRPVLRRTTRLHGDANEGAAKVNAIQTQLGRRPILAAGNSGGDREMLEWASASGETSLALLIDHDDVEREFAYASRAETFADETPITEVGQQLGWTVVSMAADWDTVFSAAPVGNA
jgi:phosphoserine phosphatase